jgi:hypothetical protein
MGICMVGLWENLLIDQFGREGAIKIMFVSRLNPENRSKFLGY